MTSMRIRRALRRNARLLALAGSTCAVAALGGCKDFGSPLPIVNNTPTTHVTIVSPAPGNPKMRPGGSLQFAAEVRDASNNLMPSATVEWTSSLAGVATMATSGATTGVATGVAAGTAAIRATSGGVQSDSVLVEVRADAPAYATAEVLGVFVNSCAIAACHGGTFVSNNLHLDAALAYDDIVGAPAFVGAFLRVKPGDPDQSLIYLKVALAAPPGGGQRMPQGRPQLTAQEIAGLRAWIEAGAPR
jgi:hypothetical protein